MPVAKLPEPQDDPLDPKHARIALADPALLDRAVRQSVHHCWMMLPPEKQSPVFLAAEMHRLLDRALSDFERDLRRT